MKILAISALSILLAVSPLSYAKEPVDMKPEMKTICRDRLSKDGKVVNGKDGKPLQDCKTIKVRPKLDGTTVPPEKKK
jgi:hypothetical protein